jgi:hypothetical protein
MKNKFLSNSALILLISLWMSGCADKVQPEPAALSPTTSATHNASSLGANYDAGYKVGMDDATNLYNQKSYNAPCPNSHTTSDPPKLAGDQTDFDGGSGSGTCRYWIDPQNGQDQYYAQILAELESGRQHENAATTNEEADYYHGYVQGLTDGSIGK